MRYIDKASRCKGKEHSVAEATYSTLDPSVAIALTLTLSTSVQSRKKDWPFVRDISALLYRLRGKGYRFRGLGLRTIPDGYYSEDVETFVGQLLSMGYAIQRSPIQLDAAGQKLCDEIIEQASRDQQEEVLRVRTALQELVASSDPKP